LHRRGFTLIELLVVIAIIAILAAIMFPVFAKAKEGANRSACLNCVKQISMAMMMYLDDNDGAFAPGICGRNGQPAIFNQPGTYAPQRVPGMPGSTYQIADGTNAGFWVNWMDTMYPYIKNLKLMVCPTAKNNTVSWWGGKQPISYGYNPTINGCFGGPIIGANISEVKRPSDFIMIWDCNIAMGVAMSGYWAVRVMGPVNTWANPHSDGINVGLADGHAKYYKYNDEFIQKGAGSYKDHPDGMGCGSSPHWYLYPWPE